MTEAVGPAPERHGESSPAEVSSERERAQRMRRTLSVAFAVLVLDQATKHWALNALSGEPPRHVLWTLQWNLSFNKGMAFSTGQGIGPIIGVLAIVVVLVIVMSVRTHESRLVAIAAGFVVGGALGNLADRIFRGRGWLHGSVIDFIDFQWFPIFNVADIAVNIGGALFVLWSLFAPRVGRHA